MACVPGEDSDAAQTDLSLCWAHIPFCWFCHAAAQSPNKQADHCLYYFRIHLKLLKVLKRSQYLNTLTSDFIMCFFYVGLKGKDHKNTNEFCLKVFGKRKILIKLHGNQIFTFEDIAILCFQNDCQRRPPF